MSTVLQLKRASSSSSSPRAAAVKSTLSTEQRKLGLESAWIQRFLHGKVVLPQDDKAHGQDQVGRAPGSENLASTSILKTKEASPKTSPPRHSEYLTRTFDDGRTRKGGETSKDAGSRFSNLAEDGKTGSRAGFPWFEAGEWADIQTSAWLRIPGKAQAEGQLAQEEEPPTLTPLRILGKTVASRTGEEPPAKRSSSSSITRSLPSNFFDEVLDPLSERMRLHTHQIVASQSDASDTQSFFHEPDSNSQQEVDSLRANSVVSSRFRKRDSSPSSDGVSLEKTGGLAESSSGFRLPNLRPMDQLNLKKHAGSSSNCWLRRWMPAQARTGENPSDRFHQGWLAQ